MDGGGNGHIQFRVTGKSRSLWRDTFFRKLEAIRAGDHIHQFTNARGTIEFVVGFTEIVEPEDTRVIESRGFSELTLIRCYPFYFVGSAPHRFIVGLSAGLLPRLGADRMVTVGTKLQVIRSSELCR